MPVGCVAGTGFVVSRCYPPEFLDLCKVVFNQVTPLVHVSIVVSLHFPVRFGWNNRSCAALIKVLQEPIGVEGLVGRQRCEGDIVDQGSNPLHVVRLPRQKQKAEQVAERIDQGNDFGR